jgi:hypothetical protein
MASDPTQLPKGVPDDGVDALYGLPLDEFTPARDALAKELRGSGERDAGAWVKALKKPSAAAWVVNQLARSQGRDAKHVLDTGDALRTTQERALAGKGKPGELGGATREHADAMRALLAKAPGLLDGDGHSPSSATLDRAEETLRAIALDDEARTGFACGRLTRERQAAGLGFALADAGEPAPKRSRRAGKEKPKPAAPKRDDAKKEKERERARKDAERAQAALKEARSRHRDQQKQVADRRRELSAAEREAEGIQRKLAKATDALEKASAKASDTEAALEEAEEAAKRA